MELSDQLHASPFRPQLPLDKRLIWPQSRSDAAEKREIPLPLIKPPSDSQKNTSSIMLLLLMMMMVGIMILMKLIICE
jgi:hypothetical protein